MRKKRTIRFFGSLAKKLGTDRVDLYCDGWADLYRGLCAAFKGFRQYANAQDRYLLLYKVESGKPQPVDEKSLHFSFGDTEELCMCVEVKANDPASAAAAVATYFALTGVAYYIVFALVYIAVVVAITYVASSIMKSLVDVPAKSSITAADKNASNLFSGVANTVQQGVMVPWVFGEFEVGSILIGSQIDSLRVVQPVTDPLVTDPVGADQTG